MTDLFAMARARQALAAAGLDPHLELERLSSVTNEVWRTEEFVIRVNRRISPRLHREAILGPQLPAEVGYPEIVAYGGELGGDWLILRRMPGQMLSRCWPTMSDADRCEAVRQLAGKLKALHTTPVPDDLPEADGVPYLLDPNQLPIVSPLLATLDRFERQSSVDAGLVSEAREVVLASTPALEPFTRSTLIHGDVHFQNVLWDGTEVSALVDFEWCRGAPADLDLDVLLRFAIHPDWYVAPDYVDATHPSDYVDLVGWFQESYPEVFSSPMLFERLLMYEISYDVHDLAVELKGGPIRTPLNELCEWHPLRRLADALRGRSHIHRLAGLSSWDAADDGPATFDLPSPSTY